MLKAIEEASNNTFFFIIHDNAFKILDTIKSRCFEFKFFFTQSEKKNIFIKLAEQYKNKFDISEIEENLYFDTPGDLITYFLSLNNVNINIKKDKLACILHFIEKFKNEKNPETLSFLSLFVEMFYNELCLNNNGNLNSLLFNHSKILHLINDMKKFNLNEKNILITVKDTLLIDAK